MKLLLTGFEPFGSQSVNPSQLVVEQFAQTAVPQIELVTAVLPVDRFEGPDQLIRTFIKSQPDAVICLGEAGSNAAIAVEQVAIHSLHFNIPDNNQNQPMDKPIQPEGRAAFFSTLPVRQIVDNINAAHIPAKLSLSAGAYLCNQVMYTILHYLGRYQLKIPAGFIHLPQLPQQVVGRRPIPPSMSLETACQGVMIAIQTLCPPAKESKSENG